MTNLETLESWTRIWNGEVELAPAVCAEDFTIFFGGTVIADIGDAATGPEDLKKLITDFRSTRPGLTYSHRRLYDGGEHGVSVWNAERGDFRVGGIDVFDFTPEGKIGHVYSVTGERAIG